MQWWCSARATPWEWSWQPYPGVWLFILLILGGWAFLRRRAGRGDGPGDRRRGETAAFAGGLLLLWIALDWPVGALGAGYLASVHMVQFLLIALVAPPLLLLGLPEEPLRAVEARPVAGPFLRILTRPLVAFALFNGIVGLTHWPPVVDGLMATQWGSFLLDLAWLGAGTTLWWPVVSPVPRRPGFGYPLKMGYLLLNTITSTGVFAFLVYSDYPVYDTYALAPPLPGVSTRTDQQVAGFLMKVGGALVLWTAVTILFARWYLAHEEGRSS